MQMGNAPCNMTLCETRAPKIKPNVPRQRFVPVTKAATCSTAQHESVLCLLQMRLSDVWTLNELVGRESWMNFSKPLSQIYALSPSSANRTLK